MTTRAGVKMPRLIYGMLQHFENEHYARYRYAAILTGAHSLGWEMLKAYPFFVGTAWKKEKTTELVTKAVLTGFRGIDTACQPKHYSEALVGKALQDLKYVPYS